MVATVTFNGLSLDVDPYHLEVIEGLLGSPEVRTADRPLVGRSGMVAGVDRYSGRSVTMNVNINATDQTVFSAAVAAFSTAFAVAQEEDAPLSFTIPGVAAGTAARLNVRPRKVALPIQTLYHKGYGSAAVELFASDPLIYSDAQTTTTVSIANLGGGRVYDRTYDVTYAGGASYGSVVVNNIGSTLAPVVVRINGPVTNPTVRNVTTGQSLTLTATIDAGHFVDLDSTARTVMLDGTADRYSYLTTPQWFGLAPGLNEIRYFADIATASTATVTYRSAWI